MVNTNEGRGGGVRVGGDNRVYLAADFDGWLVMVELITRAELENFARIFHVPLRAGENEKILRLRILATMNAPVGQRPKEAQHFEQISRLGIWRPVASPQGQYVGLGDDALFARGEKLLIERRARVFKS